MFGSRKLTHRFLSIPHTELHVSSQKGHTYYVRSCIRDMAVSLEAVSVTCHSCYMHEGCIRDTWYFALLPISFWQEFMQNDRSRDVCDDMHNDGSKFCSDTHGLSELLMGSHRPLKAHDCTARVSTMLEMPSSCCCAQPESFCPGLHRLQVFRPLTVDICYRCFDACCSR